MISKKVIIFVVSIFVLLCSEAFSKEISIESLLPRKLPEGWTQVSSPQVYTQKTLFNRIDGQAELFLKYGFQKSVFTIYQNKANSKDQIEVDLYDMGNVLQAFGIFSRFRSEDRPAGVGLESYLEDSSLLFYKGRHFVMLYATEVDPSLLKSMAMTVSSSITDSSPAPKEIDYFPKDGLKPGSIEYHPEGLLGYQFFKRGFQGIYEEKVVAKMKVENPSKAKVEDKEYYVFLAIFKNSKELEDGLTRYKDTLSKRGRVDSEASTSLGSKVFKGEDPQRGKILVVPKGSYLVGIVGFENGKKAENLLVEIISNIK